MLNHSVWSRFMMGAILGLLVYPQISVGEPPLDQLIEQLSAGPLKSSQISSEATKVLPAQPEDRGELMPYTPLRC